MCHSSIYINLIFLCNLNQYNFSILIKLCFFRILQCILVDPLNSSPILWDLRNFLKIHSIQANAPNIQLEKLYIIFLTKLRWYQFTDALWIVIFEIKTQYRRQYSSILQGAYLANRWCDSIRVIDPNSQFLSKIIGPISTLWFIFCQKGILKIPKNIVIGNSLIIDI